MIPSRLLLALALLVTVPTVPEAAERGARIPHASTAALAAARAFLCPFGGAPSRGRRGGRGLCRAPTGPVLAGNGSASEVAGWDAGLPPAGHRQVPCPEGSAPTAALARPESVRCLPR